MNYQQVIQTFTDFFTERQHHLIPSASLVPPPGDPVLFTSAGMHPLTPYLEGRPHPAGSRLVNVQRCLRTTDLDEVGDRSHLTVFEMLGSWSLGDYPGTRSVRWGLELVRDGFGIPVSRLYATVYGGPEYGGTEPGVGPDTDLADTWADLGVPVELSGVDNWWSNGPSGLCGTDSELFVWTGDGPPRGTPGSDSRWLELWNHVLLRYWRLDDGRLKPLDRPNVDTGMGLERLLTVLQGADSVFGTDLLQPWTSTRIRPLAAGGEQAAAGHRPPAVQRGGHRRRGTAVQYRARLRAAPADPPCAHRGMAGGPGRDPRRSPIRADHRHAAALRPGPAGGGARQRAGPRGAAGRAAAVRRPAQPGPRGAAAAARHRPADRGGVPLPARDARPAPRVRHRHARAAGRQE